VIWTPSCRSGSFGSCSALSILVISSMIRAATFSSFASEAQSGCACPSARAWQKSQRTPRAPDIPRMLATRSAWLMSGGKILRLVNFSGIWPEADVAAPETSSVARTAAAPRRERARVFITFSS